MHSNSIKTKPITIEKSSLWIYADHIICMYCELKHEACPGLLWKD